MLDGVLLEPEQEELLILLVEAIRNVPRDQRSKFYVAQTLGGDSLIHPGVPNEKSEIYYGDVEILASQGLVNLGFGSRGSPNFDVTPFGFQYYRHLKEKLGQPVERVERSIMSFLEADDFQAKYPLAFEKWTSAQELLWAADNQKQLTTIGHLCREALQEFTDVLITEMDLQVKMVDKAKTVARLRAIIAKKKATRSSSEHPFLDALIVMWGCINDLVQRQEHGAVKEGETLIWEDARRVAFNTLIVMYEIDKAVHRE